MKLKVKQFEEDCRDLKNLIKESKSFREKSPWILSLKKSKNDVNDTSKD